MKTTLNKTILFLSAAAILSCDNDKNDIPVEQSIEDFSISLKNVSQQSAEIQWSPVVGSQENEILYDVYLSEGKNFPAKYTQVAKDIKDTSYAFNELTSCADYYAYIEAHDPKGNVNRQSFYFKTCTPDISGTYEVFSSIIVGPLYNNYPSLDRYKSQIQITNNKDGTYTTSDITAGVIAKQRNSPKSTYPAIIITDNCGEYTASLKNVDIGGNPCNVNFKGNYDPDSEDIVIEFSWTAKFTQYRNKQIVEGFMRKLP